MLPAPQAERGKDRKRSHFHECNIAIGGCLSATARNRQMSSRTIGIIVHGATGRIGSRQHLKEGLPPIRAEGGLVVGDDRVVPQLILVGRDKERLAAVARENGGVPWTTDLDGALSDPACTVLFDAAGTYQRKATL